MRDALPVALATLTALFLAWYALVRRAAKRRSKGEEYIDLDATIGGYTDFWRIKSLSRQQLMGGLDMNPELRKQLEELVDTVARRQEEERAADRDYGEATTRLHVTGEARWSAVENLATFLERHFKTPDGSMSRFIVGGFVVRWGAGADAALEVSPIASLVQKEEP